MWLLIGSAVNNVRGKKRKCRTICLGFSVPLPHRRVKEDAPHQEPVERCIQREGNLCFVHHGNVAQGKLIVQCNPIGPGQM